ncbi:unnamed protein product [Cochlearia groenlandica]
MESQMTRPYGYEQTQDPIRTHHPEEEEHGASKVLKTMKEKAKKIKNKLTKHGHGHEHDHDFDEEEDDEYDEQDPEVHGAPVYESTAVRGGVTGQPETLSHPRETNIPSPEEIVPPGTKVFPVVSADHTKPIEPEPLHDTSYGHEALSEPFKLSDLSDREESREAHHEAMNTPASLLAATEDVTRTFSPGGEDEYLGGQRKVNVERPKGLEEDPAAPGGGSDYLSRVSNYQSKVNDPTHKGGEAGVPEIAESLGRMKVTDESKLGQRFDSDVPRRSHEFGLKNESGKDKDSPMGLESGSIAGLSEDYPTIRSGDSPAERYETKKTYPASSHDVNVEDVLPTGTHDQFSPELTRPKEKDYIDSKAEEMRDETEKPKKQSTYTDKLAYASSAIAEKAIAAKNVVTSKLGYSGENTGTGGKQEKHMVDETPKSATGHGAGGQQERPVVEETPRSATGYGQKVAGTVAEKLAPVYEKVKETGSTVMTKLPLSGGGSGTEETHQGKERSVSAKDYLAGKLTPGEEDKALSEVIAETLHLGGGGEKKKTITKEVEVTLEKIPSDQVPEGTKPGETVVEEVKRGGGAGGGMVTKIKGWLGGAAEPKPAGSVEESPQSLGSTVGTKGFSDSSAGGGGRVQSGLQGPGN